MATTNAIHTNTNTTPTVWTKRTTHQHHVTMSPPQEILQRQDDMTLCKGLYYIDTTTASVSQVPGMSIIYLIYYYCIIVLVFIGIHAMKFYGILNGMTMRFV